MKNNVIWVDFIAKTKGKSRAKKFPESLLQWFKELLSHSKKYHTPKTIDKYHKSIL
jgi:hypothetical protein